MKYWETIADNLKKPVGVTATHQRWIVKAKQSSLQTRIETGSASLCVRMKS